MDSNRCPRTLRTRTTSFGAVLLSALVVPMSTSVGPFADVRGAGPLADAGRRSDAAQLEVPPDWMKVDQSEKTVTLEVVAGKTEANNRWNFNGYANGQATITVPRGYGITIEFRNDDSDIPHSLGVGELPDSSFPPMFEDPQPVFEGAISASPTSMTESTLPGESETVAFTVDEAGEFALLCYIPAHAVTGMWIRFVVSDEGEAGFEANEAGDG